MYQILYVCPIGRTLCLMHPLIHYSDCIHHIHTQTNTQMSQLFMNDYSKGEIFKSPEVYANQKLPNALTFHSFKDPNMMHRIHQFYIELAVNNSMVRTNQLKRDLEQVSKRTNRQRAFA